MFDKAHAIAGTLELCSMTQEKLARQMGVSQSYIANKLRLLNFSEEMTELIRKSGVSERHARSLLRIDDEEVQRGILEKVKDRSLSVRECEALVDSEAIARVPRAVGEAQRHKALDVFFDSISSSVEALRSLGISATVKRSIYEKKTYLLISLENE